jgi:guanylate kinase
MSTFTVNLNKLVDPSKTDSISGRSYGEGYAREINIVQHLLDNENVVVEIDPKQVKAINDSFIKGFFSSVFDLLKSKKRVQERFQINGGDYYKRLFEKNWSILDSINAVA